MRSSDMPSIDVLEARVVTLDNGLTLIVREDRSAPVVAAQVWCRAGSVDEGRWLGAGLSHVLEHMLFKGTTTRGPGRIDQEVHDAGGYMNAYTSFDRTVYWINVPNTGARVAVDILSDIVQHATLPAEELVRELDVIRREMDMGQDDPGRRSSRRLFETAYTRSPYRYPIIGVRDIFDTLQREDVAAYYREKYAPNNLFFVAVGDLDAEAVIDQVKEAFAGARARPVPGVPLIEEPRQTAVRELVEEDSVELGHMHCSWHIPELLDPDVPALDLLSVVLGAGRSSRLFQEVREKAGLVHSAEAWTYNPGSPGLFGFSAVIDGDKYRAATDALLREVERVQAEAVLPRELAKAVKQVTAATLAARKTMQGQAQELGSSWQAVGDLGFSVRYLDTVRGVTADCLKRVARRHLTASGRSQFALLPRGARTVTNAVEAMATRTPVALFSGPNGLRILVREDHRLPFVELRAVLRGGVLSETPADSGITGLMTKMLLKGTPRRTAEEVASEIESVGGSIDAYAGNNSFGVTLEVLSGDLELGFDLLADVLLHPAFPEAELVREREYQLATIRAQRDQMLQLAGRAMRRALFGDRGYGLDASGTEESVQGLTLDGIRAFHRRLTVPNNCVLAVYGQVETERVRRLVTQSFGDWAAGAAVEPSQAIDRELRGIVRVEERREKKQSVVVVGFRGTEITNRDRHALELIQEACSDLGSRVFVRIRDELGLAYYVGAQNMVGLVPGYFSFYAGTEPAKTEQVVAEFMGEVERLRRDGLTADELRRAKAKVIGQKKISRQDLGACAMTQALDELYGLGYAYSDGEDALFEAVTSEDVVRVARRFLTPEACVVSLVRPAGSGEEPGDFAR